ncbi:MAG TPA: cytochrome c peroxidase [Rhodothermales bacterium]|nr:cytochrome c peroxidase [Rhodothermales bacterium]
MGKTSSRFKAIRPRLWVIYFFWAPLWVGCDHQNQPSQAPTPLNLTLPPKFPELPPSPENPLTIQGVTLGRALFYDKSLSRDETISCASCHIPDFGFSDPNALSRGVGGLTGERQSMPLINLGWIDMLFWDGRAASLEEQALFPITSHFEMGNTFPEIISRLNASLEYPRLFRAAFSSPDITQTRILQALAQFQRTLVSGNSKYDQWLQGKTTLTSEEEHGYTLFFTEKGDCFHCHGTLLMTDNRFHNNGLDDVPADSGRYRITKDPADIGLFRSPTLRNIALTAPYMHDGRFNTLQEVINHYDHGLVRSPTLDPLFFNGRPKGLSEVEKKALIAFLNTLSDPEFTQNPTFRPN